MAARKAVTLRITPGDVVVFMVARDRRAMERLARGKHGYHESFTTAARRILKRLDRHGITVAEASRQVLERQRRRDRKAG